MLRLVSISIATLMVIAGAALAEDSKKVELSAVPQKVVDTAMKEVSGFKPTTANTEMEDGKTVYELQGMAGDKKVEVDVMEDGTLDEVETEVEMGALPEAVSKAVMDKMPNFKPSKIEESRRTAGTYYEIEGADGSNKIDIEIKADGSSMKAEKLASGS